MRMTLLVGIWLSFTSLAHAAPPENCAKIWSAGFPISELKKSFPCFKYSKVDGGTASHHIYYAATQADESGAPKPEVIPVLNRIAAAVSDSDKVYRAFDSVPSAAIIYTGLKSSRSRSAEVPFRHSVGSEPVAMVVYTDLLADSPAEQQQTLAHEMWHVFQYRHLSGSWSHPASQWWVEGSADYFSNLVYPSTNREWPNAEAYDSDLPLFGQPSATAYSSTVYFQAMGNGWSGADGVVTLLRSLAADSNSWAALSRYPSMELHFANFAKQYTLTQIADTGGGMLPTHYVLPPSRTVPDAGLSEVIPASPFVIQESRFTLPGGKRWKVQIARGGSDTLSASSIREGQDREWQDLYDGSPMALDLSCRSTPKGLRILSTSTNGPGTEASKLILLIENEAKECACKTTKIVAPSLVGRWRMREESLRDFLQLAFGMMGTIDRVTGNIMLTIGEDHQFKFVHDHTTVDAHDNDGIRYRAEFWGAATDAIVQAPDLKQMCLTDVKSEGTLRLTVTFPGLPPVSSEEPVSEAFDEGEFYAIELKGDVLRVKRVLEDRPEPAHLIFDRM